MDIYDRLGKVGDVGGIVGTSVSASFLFLVAVINSYFLVGAIRARKIAKERERLSLPPDEDVGIQGGGCLVRIIGPVLRAVDKPWKLYPVGILFGGLPWPWAQADCRLWLRHGVVYRAPGAQCDRDARAERRVHRTRQDHHPPRELAMRKS